MDQIHISRSSGWIRYRLEKVLSNKTESEERSSSIKVKKVQLRRIRTEQILKKLKFKKKETKDLDHLVVSGSLSICRLSDLRNSIKSRLVSSSTTAQILRHSLPVLRPRMGLSPHSLLVRSFMKLRLNRERCNSFRSLTTALSRGPFSKLCYFAHVQRLEEGLEHLKTVAEETAKKDAFLALKSQNR